MAILQDTNMKHHAQWIKQFHRYVGYNLAKLLSKTPVTANQVTAFRFPCVCAASILIALGDYRKFLLATFLIYLFAMLDAADGSLAKMKRTSYFGAWLDTQIDQIGFLILFIGISLNLKLNKPDGSYWILITMGTLVMVHIRAWIPWLVRHKKSFHGIEVEARPPSDNLGRRSLVATLKMQIGPHNHNIWLIIIIGLLINRIDWMIIFLSLYITFWWVWTTSKISKRLINYDRGRHG